MNKEKLRKEYLDIRKNVIDKKIKDKSILNKIISLCEYEKKDLILTYVSLNDEVDTTELIKYSLKNGKQVAVPKCEGDIIKFYYIDSLKELKEGHYNILEPESKKLVTDFKHSICIVPGICFDKEKNRVGYGKGYYDRFLKNYEGLKIGLAYKECICDKIDVEENDVKMDRIITC